MIKKIKNQNGFTPTPEKLILKNKNLFKKNYFTLNKIQKNKQQVWGFTLIEIVIYIAFFSILTIAAINSIFNILTAYQKGQFKKSAINEANYALKTMLSEIEQSRKIYTQTSSFGTAAGQLSLETIQNIPIDETYGFEDIYLDNGKIWIKREKQNAVALTSDKNLVTNLNFIHLDAGTNYESVKITIDIESREGKPETKARVNLTSTATPRGDY